MWGGCISSLNDFAWQNMGIDLSRFMGLRLMMCVEVESSNQRSSRLKDSWKFGFNGYGIGFPSWSLWITMGYKVWYSHIVVMIHDGTWVGQKVYSLYLMYSQFEIHVFLKVVGLSQHLEFFFKLCVCFWFLQVASSSLWTYNHVIIIFLMHCNHARIYLLTSLFCIFYTIMAPLSHLWT